MTEEMLSSAEPPGQPSVASAMLESRRALEAMVLVASDPVPTQQLAQLLELSVDSVDRLCRDVAASYEAAGHGFQLVEVAGGWRYQTHPDLHPYVERYAMDGQSTRLSSAALETLAIVAYKQPISRAQVSAIRGVSVDAVLRTLEQRGYVEEVGRDTGAGQAVLFGTTPYFLERVGLSGTEDLPSLGEFVPAAEVVEALEQTLKVEVEPSPDAEEPPADDDTPANAEAEAPVEAEAERDEAEAEAEAPAEVEVERDEAEAPVEVEVERDEALVEASVEIEAPVEVEVEVGRDEAPVEVEALVEVERDEAEASVEVEAPVEVEVERDEALVEVEAPVEAEALVEVEVERDEAEEVEVEAETVDVDAEPAERIPEERLPGESPLVAPTQASAVVAETARLQVNLPLPPPDAAPQPAAADQVDIEEQVEIAEESEVRIVDPPAAAAAEDDHETSAAERVSTPAEGPGPEVPAGDFPGTEVTTATVTAAEAAGQTIPQPTIPAETIEEVGDLGVLNLGDS